MYLNLLYPYQEGRMKEFHGIRRGHQYCSRRQVVVGGGGWLAVAPARRFPQATEIGPHGEIYWTFAAPTGWPAQIKQIYIVLLPAAGIVPLFYGHLHIFCSLSLLGRDSLRERGTGTTASARLAVPADRQTPPSPRKAFNWGTTLTNREEIRNRNSNPISFAERSHNGKSQGFLYHAPQSNEPTACPLLI